MGILDTLTRDRKRMGLLSAGIGMLGAKSMDEGMRRGYAGLLAGLQQADQTETDDYRQAMVEREMQLRELADQREAELLPIRDMKARAEMANALRGPELKTKAPWWAQTDESGNFIGVDPVAFEAYTKAQQADPMARALQQLQLTGTIQQQELARQNAQRDQERLDMQRREQLTKPMTADQSNALGFAKRMQAANSTLQGLNGFDPTSISGQLQRAATESGLTNSLASPEAQSYSQAARDFVTAVLRKESGAAISPTEFDQAYKTYFPQTGDAPDVVKQKEAARMRATENFMAGVPQQYATQAQLPQAGIEGAGEIKTLPDGRRYRIISYSPDGNHEIELLQ